MNKQAKPSVATQRQPAQTLVRLERHSAAIPNFDDLPNTAWVRQAQLVRDPKHPTRPTPLPFSAATFWRLVASKKFPQPTRLSERVTAWKVGDVRAWIDAQTQA